MDQKQQNILALAIAVVLIALAVWQFMPLNQKIRQGLDIQGGVSVILTAQPTTGTVVSSEAMDRAETVVRNRVDGLGVSEASVQRQGGDSILVQLPGIKDPQAALKAIGSTGLLEFVDWESVPASQAAAWSAYLDKGGVRPEPLKSGTYKVIMSGSTITKASVGSSGQGGQVVVNIAFDANGTKTWAEYTAAHVGKQIGIVLDGSPQSAPQVREAITDGNTQISGSFTADEAKQLATVLQTGALPVKLIFSDSRVVGPTLGQSSLQQGLLAALVGFGLVLLYMAAYYRGLGLLTWVSLVAFAAVYLGVLAVLSAMGAFALSLPGIAGIVLTIGLAADSTILILERFKEEVRQGKTYRTAAKSGSRHAIGTSIDADLTTFVSAVVLFSVAIGPVRGFALTLMIGIVVDLTIAILLTRSVLMLLAESVIAKAPGFFGVKGGATNA
jgi:preprotein translocase subunit SecD